MTMSSGIFGPYSSSHISGYRDIVECGVASLPNLQCLLIGGWVWVEASRVV